VNSGELKRAKRRVRREVLAARDAIPGPERARRSERIAERFLALPELREAACVMAFWSFGSEVDTAPLIDGVLARGATVTLPRIEGDVIDAVTWRPGEAVGETSFGAREPAGGHRVEPATIDVVVTPGVAFDREGRRVGYGGGFYDRFLPRTDAARIGVAFDVQVLDQDLPAGAFDLRIEAIVTESEVLRCPP